LVGEGDLLELQFRVLEGGAGDIQVLNPVVSDEAGGFNHLNDVFATGLIPLPEAIKLKQSYPNPFNPATHIPYELPQSALVRLTIYNVLGQQVKVLREERQTAGYHQALWDGTDQVGRSVSTGIYFVHFEADDFVGIQKVMLLK